MKLYHGSDVIVDNPKILEKNRPLDFGCGFYLMSNKDQAQKWALRVARRNGSKNGFISSYEFDLEKALKELIVLRFNDATKEWLEFVCCNRRGQIYEKKYDIVIGPVADDKVYSVVVRFENGEYELDEALKRLKIEQLSDQVLFHNEKALKYLQFVTWEKTK